MMTTTEDERVEELAFRVIGAAIAVHRALGPGYAEAVYEEALAIELRAQQVPFRRQHAFEVTYRGLRVGDGRVDLLVDEMLVVELKAVIAVGDVHRAQVLAYLKGLDLHLGLILNFNHEVLKDGIFRIIR